MNCCDILRINGVVTHEIGCPNQGTTPKKAKRHYYVGIVKVTRDRIMFATSLEPKPHFRKEYDPQTEGRGHTPTPWTVRHGEKNGETFVEIVGMKTEIVDYFVSRSWGTRPEDEANAAFIVRAVNCHSELLEACKQARSFVKDHQDGDTAYLDSIIAKAEGL